MHDIILHRIRHGMVNSSRLSFYLDLLSPEDNFGSLSSDSFELGDQNVVFDPGIFFIHGVFSFTRKTPHLLIGKVTLVFAILSLNPFVEIPSSESKVHIEVLSVLWGNRLLIPDRSLQLSR
ncbi:hypothetical protein Tco_0581774 [Tanacetum coccineum]